MLSKGVFYINRPTSLLGHGYHTGRQIADTTMITKYTMLGAMTATLLIFSGLSIAAADASAGGVAAQE